MTKDELVARLQAYEWNDFECKKARAEVPKDAYSTVSAFANTQGGWLLFGVSENNGQLDVTGIDRVAFDRVQDAFLTTLRSGQKLNHLISVEPQVYEVEGKRILAFYIPEQDRHQKPLYLNGNPRDTYIRRGARDERATDNELQRFLRDSPPHSWDSDTVTDVIIESSIDGETLQWYQTQFNRRNPEKRPIDKPLDFLEEWNFLAIKSDKLCLTRAAVLLFGQDHAVRSLLLRPVVDYQRIDARFDTWSSQERWHDRFVFEENLFKTWRGLVAKYSRIAEHPFSIDPSTMRRSDDPPDYIAFREAAINLLIHQDYGDSSRKASIKWFTDRLQFWNPGNAFANKEQLLESNEQDIRNPLIVNAFRRIGLSDQAGTGIRAIVRNWRELGRVAPLINNDKSAKSFELVLEQEPLITPAMHQFQKQIGVHLDAEKAAILAQVSIAGSIQLAEAAMIAGITLRQAAETLQYLCSQQLLSPASEGVFRLTDPIRLLLEKQQKIQKQLQLGPTEGTKSGLSQDQAVILSKCLVPQSIVYLMSITGRSNRTKFRNQIINPMLEGGWLEMAIPDKPTSSKQKYQLTDLGKQALEQIK